MRRTRGVGAVQSTIVLAAELLRVGAITVERLREVVPEITD